MTEDITQPKQKMPEPKLPCDDCTKAAWKAAEAMQSVESDAPKTGDCYCRHKSVLITYTWEFGREPVITLLQGLSEQQAIAGFAAVVAKNQGIADVAVPVKPMGLH